MFADGLAILLSGTNIDEHMLDTRSDPISVSANRAIQPNDHPGFGERVIRPRFVHVNRQHRNETTSGISFHHELRMQHCINPDAEISQCQRHRVNEVGHVVRDDKQEARRDTVGPEGANGGRAGNAMRAHAMNLLKRRRQIGRTEVAHIERREAM